MVRFRGILLGLSLLLVTACSLPGLWSFSEQPSPEDLDGCCTALDSLLKPEVIDSIRLGSEEDLWQYHFGLGMWMRNEWGLWRGSKLKQWFEERGIFHPDDMSGIILTSYWRYLNDRPIELDNQIASYQKYWIEHAVSIEMSCPKCGKELVQHVAGRELDPIHDTDYVRVYSCENGHAFFCHFQRELYEPESEQQKILLDSLAHFELPDAE